MSDIVERLREYPGADIRIAADEIERLQRVLQKVMARCADLLDEDQFNELDAIACIASGERDATYAQLAEAQRFPHGAAAVTGCDMKINDEGSSNAAYWYERAMKAEARLQPLEETIVAQSARNVLLEARLQKIMARCADLLDEDQFNELDAMTRATVRESDDAR